MSDEALSLTISADVAQFLKNMGEVQTQIQSTVKGLQDFTEQTQKAGAAHSASATSIGLSVVSWQAVASAARDAAEGLYDFGEASINAANVIDPSGALKWNEAVDNLKDSFTRFAGAIGKELRPVIEDAMGKVTEVFAKLSRMDWGEVGAHMLSALKKAFDGIKSWATDVLEVLTFPFRAMVGFVETALGQVMEIVGKAAKELGGTSIGKKLGLSEFSGDAFTQTGANMQAQGAKIAGSLKGAMEEVGKGLGMGVDAALGALKNDPDVKAILDAYKGASGKAVKNVNDSGDIALINAAQLQQEQIGKLYERVMGKSAADQLRASTQSLELERQRADLQKSAADYDFQQALGDKTNAFASYDAAVAAAQRVHDAYQGSVDALKQEVDAAQSALTKQSADEKSAAKAVADMKDKADAAMALNQNKLISAEQRATNDGIIQEYQLRLQQENQARMFRQQTEGLLGQKRLSFEQLLEAMRLDGIKREQQLRQKQVEQFTAITSKIGGITGTVGSAAAQGFVQGGPVGAVTEGIQSLMENSAGFKKVQDAINGIMQKVADTLGRVFEPLVPIIQAIGDALGPLLDALGNIFGAAGRNLAAALQPLVPVIAMVANLLAQILAPVGQIMDAIRPLIPILVEFTEIMLAISSIGFAPLLIAVKALAPVLKVVADVIQAVVKGIATVWNGILHVLEGVFDALAHALPSGAGDAMRDVYNGLVSMEIPIDDLQSATTNATQAIVEMTAAAQATIDSMTQANQAWQTAHAQQVGYADALAAARAGGASQDVIDDIQKALDQATQQANVASDQERIAAIQNQIETGQRSASDPATQQLLANAYAQLAVDQANTSATAANTKATQDLIAALPNTPTGFRVGAYEYGATGSSFPAVGGAPGAGSSPIVIAGDIHVSANDAAGFIKGLRKHASKSRGGGTSRWS